MKFFLTEELGTAFLIFENQEVTFIFEILTILTKIFFVVLDAMTWEVQSDRVLC
jgi:hypothetical protein